jgi:hypothetical protein
MTSSGTLTSKPLSEIYQRHEPTDRRMNGSWFNRFNGLLLLRVRRCRQGTINCLWSYFTVSSKLIKKHEVQSCQYRSLLTIVVSCLLPTNSLSISLIPRRTGRIFLILAMTASECRHLQPWGLVGRCASCCADPSVAAKVNRANPHL